jgi:hypothetical protein
MDCREPRKRATCGETVQRDWPAGRTFNHPDVRNGLRLVVVAALANIATCILAIWYVAS